MWFTTKSMQNLCLFSHEGVFRQEFKQIGPFICL